MSNLIDKNIKAFNQKNELIEFYNKEELLDFIEKNNIKFRQGFWFILKNEPEIIFSCLFELDNIG